MVTPPYAPPAPQAPSPHQQAPAYARCVQEAARPCPGRRRAYRLHRQDPTSPLPPMRPSGARAGASSVPEARPSPRRALCVHPAPTPRPTARPRPTPSAPSALLENTAATPPPTSPCRAAPVNTALQARRNTPPARLGSTVQTPQSSSRAPLLAPCVSLAPLRLCPVLRAITVLLLQMRFSAHPPATVLQVPLPRIPVLLHTSVLTLPPKSCATLGPIAQQAPPPQCPAPPVPIVPPPPPRSPATSPTTAPEATPPNRCALPDRIAPIPPPSAPAPSPPTALPVPSRPKPVPPHSTAARPPPSPHAPLTTSASSTSRRRRPAPSVLPATTPARSAPRLRMPFALDALPEPTTPQQPTPLLAPRAERAPLASTSSPPATPPPTSPAPSARSEATVQTPPPPTSWRAPLVSIVWPVLQHLPRVQLGFIARTPPPRSRAPPTATASAGRRLPPTARSAAQAITGASTAVRPPTRCVPRARQDRRSPTRPTRPSAPAATPALDSTSGQHALPVLMQCARRVRLAITAPRHRW